VPPPPAWGVLLLVIFLVWGSVMMRGSGDAGGSWGRPAGRACCTPLWRLRQRASAGRPRVVILHARLARGLFPRNGRDGVRRAALMGRSRAGCASVFSSSPRFPLSSAPAPPPFWQRQRVARGRRPARRSRLHRAAAARRAGGATRLGWPVVGRGACRASRRPRPRPSPPSMPCRLECLVALILVGRHR